MKKLLLICIFGSFVSFSIMAQMPKMRARTIKADDPPYRAQKVFFIDKLIKIKTPSSITDNCEDTKTIVLSHGTKIRTEKNKNDGKVYFKIEYIEDYPPEPINFDCIGELENHVFEIDKTKFEDILREYARSWDGSIVTVPWKKSLDKSEYRPGGKVGIFVGFKHETDIELQGNRLALSIGPVIGFDNTIELVDPSNGSEYEIKGGTTVAALVSLGIGSTVFAISIGRDSYQDINNESVKTPWISAGFGISLSNIFLKQQ